MKIEVSVPEVVTIFKEIQTQPEKLFEMIRLDVRELVGRYLSEVMKAELSHFLGREPYERTDSYPHLRPWVMVVVSCWRIKVQRL